MKTCLNIKDHSRDLKLSFCITVLCLTFSTFSHSFNGTWDGFMENKGQFHDEKWEMVENIEYVFASNGMNIYLTQSGFSYDARVIENFPNEPKAKELEKDLEQIQSRISHHQIDFEFLNASPKMTIGHSRPNETYYNFYLAHTPKEGITKVETFESITYKNVYDDIDIVFLSEENDGKCNFKYNIILGEKANIDDIAFKINGVDAEIKSDQIIFKTRIGEIIEEIPLSWESNESSINAAEKILREVNFKFLGNNSFGFEMPNKKRNSKFLIIDPYPSFKWSAYFGGSSSEKITDLKGYGTNMYAIGRTSSIDLEIYSPTQQTSNNGGVDMFICSYKANGTLNWVTYYGGEAQDWGMEIDAFDNHLLIGGITWSQNGISHDSNHQEDYPGHLSAVVAKFDLEGFRVWATYFAGTDENGNTSLYTISHDSEGYIYIAGSTHASEGIATSNAFDTSLEGLTDGFIQKFKEDGARVWGTYYGGYSNNAIYDMDVDHNGDIYFSGASSYDNDLVTQGAFLTTNLDGYVGYFGKFNTVGERQWGSMFYSPIQTIELSCSDYIYIGGHSTEEESVYSNFATSGATQTSFQGGQTDGFVQKFKTNGTREWGTFLGGDQNDRISDIHSRESGSIYAVGGSSSELEFISEDAYQPTLSSSEIDGLFCKIENTGEIEYATYLGAESSDQFFAVSAMADPSESIKEWYHVFAAGETWSETGASTNGTTYSGLKDGLICSFHGSWNVHHCKKDLEISVIPTIDEHQIYPNPFNDNLMVSSPNEILISSIIIRNQNGKVILRQSENSSLAEIDLKSASSGLYFLTLLLENGQIITEKIVKL